MNPKYKQLGDDVLDVLRHQVACVGNLVRMPPLERKLYERVNAALVLLGGQWSKRDKAHVFQVDPASYLAGALADGEVFDEKKSFQFFPTPAALARKLVQALGHIDSADRLLEPSAGEGALADALLDAGVDELAIDLCELNPRCVDILNRKGYTNVIAGDFLAEHPRWYGRMYDKIIANPPATASQDIDHVRKMWDLLRPGGRLVVLMSPGWQDGSQKKQVDFRDWLDEENVLSREPLPEGTFPDTHIRTVLLTLQKADDRGAYSRHSIMATAGSGSTLINGAETDRDEGEESAIWNLDNDMKLPVIEPGQVFPPTPSDRAMEAIAAADLLAEATVTPVPGAATAVSGRRPAAGWTDEQWAALPGTEQRGILFGFGRYAYQPADPRIPARQREIHDLFAGKSYAEIRGLLESFIGEAVPEKCRTANRRRLRRAAGLSITKITSFDKVVSRVEEWAHKLLQAGDWLDDFTAQIREACEEAGLVWGGHPGGPQDEFNKVNTESPLGELLAAIVDEHEHIGLSVLDRVIVKIFPTTDGKKTLEDLRAKISAAATAGTENFPLPTQLLGQYESYFAEKQLRTLPPEVLAAVARSLGIRAEHVSVAFIHQIAAARFNALRGLVPDPTLPRAWVSTVQTPALLPPVATHRPVIPNNKNRHYPIAQL